ncbi:PREDICTED: uncharacterized protein LOC104809457 [Tarenaya hassleriana]|uniref:uncharacterized protein LOC104809457 n=1 Tax=Tarenaya hassleriana TaxID=28532 RepID=UPI00053C2753|nr:PREDICTED: uncharacterized protein LOC104809457 [Tarenaya hassleriana]
MALLTFYPEKSEPPQTQKKQPLPSKRKKRQIQPRNAQTRKPQKQTPQKLPSSWDQFKNLLTCKQIEGSRIHDPSKNSQSEPYITATHPNSSSKLITSSCGSICSFRDVAHGNTRVVHRADNSPGPGNPIHDPETRILNRKSGQPGSSSSRSLTSVSKRSNGRESYTSSSSTATATTTTSLIRGMQFRKLSGCYECHMIVDPSRNPISPRVCACSQCGEVFPKLENLEMHQAVRHAVSELGPEDSGRNVVEIIFKSSWLKKDNPICKIERILKVHNTQRTIQRFEDCRDAVKARALQTPRKDARCAADGNELLRFHCATLVCPLGARGSSSLCSVSGCGVCTLIRNGFGGQAGVFGGGVRTTASSGRAHDSLGASGSLRKAMLVCRVIAGRVKRGVVDEENGGAYDSLAENAGAYSNLEELLVFNPRAILPCFVVIYKVLES